MSGQKWKIKGMKNILFSYEFRKTVATPTPTITAAQSYFWTEGMASKTRKRNANKVEG